MKRPADPDQQEGGALCLNGPIPYVRRTPWITATELNFDVRASQINQILNVRLRNVFNGWDADRLRHDPQNEIPLRLIKTDHLHRINLKHNTHIDHACCAPPAITPTT